MLLTLITLTCYTTTILNEIFSNVQLQIRANFFPFVYCVPAWETQYHRRRFHLTLPSPLPLFSQLIPLIQGYGNDRERSWVTVCWRNYEFRDWIYLIPLHNDSRGIYLTLSRCIYLFGLTELCYAFKLSNLHFQITCTKFCINSSICYNFLNLKFYDMQIVSTDV